MIGEKEELAIGEDAVHVEEEQFDFAGAGAQGESGHGGILAVVEKNLWAGEPQDGNAPAEFLKVAVGSNESGFLRYSESSGDAVRIRNFVKDLEFSCFQCLRKINRNDLEWEKGEVIDRLSSFLLTFVPPEQVEDFTQVEDGNHERGIVAEGLSKDALDGRGSGAIHDVIEDGVGIENVGFGRGLQ